MEGIVVRRVIPSDNSCLFNAIGYVMDHDKCRAQELRQVIATTVASDPRKYNQAFLGKSNEEYCGWILNPEKWGGAIELAILSEYYGREIAAYDVQTTRCDLYGQDRYYGERVMLIYDGLHYDALALSPFEGAPEEFDQTIFTIGNNRSIGHVEGLFLLILLGMLRGRGIIQTLPISPCVAGCAKLVLLVSRRLLNMPKLRVTLIFRSISKSWNFCINQSL